MNKIGQYFDSAWKWIVTSSVNPDATSLTVKSFLTTVATIATMTAGLGHIQLSTGYETAIVDGIVQVVQQLLVIVGTISTIVGLVRKVVVTSTNQVG